MALLPFLKEKNVLVMGLGTSGRGPGLVSFLASQGAKVIVTDFKKRAALRPTLKKLKNVKVQFVLGRHRVRDFRWADFVVKNPAVPDDSPWLQIPRVERIPIISDVMLFFLAVPSTVRIVGVTGTKGKTTTATLIHQLLATRFRAHIAGIPGTSYLALLRKIGRKDLVVLELSSFDLEGLAKIRRSPEVAVITNIHRDHLNRYLTFRAYVEAKTNIFRFQSRNGTLFLNKDEKLSKFLRSMAPGRVLGFSEDEFRKRRRIFGNISRTTLNISNIIAAYKVAKFFGVSDGAIRSALAKTPALPGRLEVIAERKAGIIFVNDTCSTNPYSSAYGIRALRRLYPASPIALIAGGEDKNLDFREIASALPELASIVLLPGSASTKLRKIAIGRGVSVRRILRKREALETAIRVAVKDLIESRPEARPAGRGGIVLFSPAAASFNMFKNEFDRGRQFVLAVKRFIKSAR